MSRTLSFQSRVDKVVAKIQPRNSILACLSRSQWGWKKKSLRKLFLATQRSVLDYAAPAWQPWLANTQLERLDRAQNQALRCNTGQTASCPLEAFRLESGVQSYTTTSKRLVAPLTGFPTAPPARRSRRQHLPQTAQRQLEGEKQKT